MTVKFKLSKAEGAETMINILLNRIITKSERETLTYKNLQHLKYKLGKLANIRNHFFLKKNLMREFRLNESKKIQFGAGSGHFGEAQATEISGFVDSDIFGKIPIDVTKPLAIENDSVDVIFSSHLIEHLHQIEIQNFLEESLRVLVDGGSFVVATPSLQKVVKLLYGNKSKAKTEYFALHGQSLLGRRPTPARILNCLCHINYGHKFVMDYETFDDLCKNAGFKTTTVLLPEDIKDPGLKEYFQKKPSHYWLETEIWSAEK